MKGFLKLFWTAFRYDLMACEPGHKGPLKKTAKKTITKKK